MSKQVRSMIYDSLAESFGFVFFLVVSWLFFFISEAESYGDLNIAFMTGALIGVIVVFSLWNKRRIDSSEINSISNGMLFGEIASLVLAYTAAANSSSAPSLITISTVFIIVASLIVYVEIYIRKKDSYSIEEEDL